VVSKGETVYLTGGKKKYRKIRYGAYKGYVFNPVYSGVTDKSYYKTQLLLVKKAVHLIQVPLKR